MLKRSAGAAIALYGWVNGGLASGVARVDDRLGLGATLVGAHLAMFAVGLLVTGALPTAERLSRLAPLAFAATFVWFLVAPHPAISLAACAVLGASGSLTLARGQALLTDPLLSADPARTLMTANVIAAGTAAISAAAVGVVDPRLVVFTTTPALILAIVSLGMRRSTTESPAVDRISQDPRDDHRPARSAADRVGLVLIAVYVAIELTVANQVTGYLVGVGAGENASDAAVGVLFMGLTLGRILVAVIGARRPSALARSAAATTLLALAVLTVAPNDPIVLAALLVLGIALGPLFPLLVARVLAASQEPARTSALTTSAIGTALLLAPPIAGAARELIGDRAGMAMLATLAGLAVVLTVIPTVVDPAPETHRGQRSSPR